MSVGKMSVESNDLTIVLVLVKPLTVFCQSISFDGKLFSGAIAAKAGARLTAFGDAGAAASEDR